MRKKVAPGDAEAPGRLGAAWSQVAAVVAAVDVALGKWLVDTYGIGLTEYRAALHLSRAADRELRLNVLAHKVSLNQSSVTRLVERLERKEVAVRDTCPDDGRGVYAVLTDRGAALVREVAEPYEAKLEELLGSAAQHNPHLDLVGLESSFAKVSALVP